MSTILAAIDDSAAAMPVLGTALALAPVFGAEVEAVEVAETVGRTARSAALAAHVPITNLPGDPLEEIIRLAERDDTLAVVVGARRSASGRRPAGHLTLALADALAKPVIVVPPDSPPPARIHRALLAVAGTAHSARYLQRTVALAAGAEIELVVVHVEDEDSIPSFSDQVQYEVEAYATEFLARYVPGIPATRMEMRIGLPAEEILAAVEDVDPDIIAIGWPQRGGDGRGLVVREVLERSRLPVLLVALADGPP
jgi:nucleotide-binding universal stress UspA family protein